MRNILFFSTIGIFLFSFGCSKKNDPGQPSTTSQGGSSQVASITTTDGNAYYFSYDKQGRVTKILWTMSTQSTTKTFAYNKGQVATSAIDQDGTIVLDSLALNTDSSINTDMGYHGSYITKIAYFYSDGILDTAYSRTVTLSFGSTTFTYTWQNGDCTGYKQVQSVLITTPPTTNTFTYTYYENQPAQVINAFTLGDYENYGNSAFTKRTTHLVKTEQFNNGGTLNYTYIYDDQGRVSGIQHSGLDNITTTIAYYN